MPGTPIAINTNFNVSAGVSAGVILNILQTGTFETFDKSNDIIDGYSGNVSEGLFNGQLIISGAAAFNSYDNSNMVSQSYVTVYNQNYSPTSQSFFDVIYFDNAGANSSPSYRAYQSLRSYLPETIPARGFALAFHRDLFKDRINPTTFSASIANTVYGVTGTKTEPPYQTYYNTNGNGKLYPAHGLFIIGNSSYNGANGVRAAIDFISAQSKQISKSYIYFARVKNSKCNHSNNKTFTQINQSTGENLIKSNIRFADNNKPITYITSIGLHNDNNELLAVGKLSNPVFKSYSNELLIKVKVDF